MTDDADETELTQRLQARRPSMRAARRGQMRRSLLARGVPPARPAHLWWLAAAFALSGLVLLVLAALQI